ncbi:alpha/beta fold hydrolase [Solidesulfovibrio carbinolicus]|uniref:Alpha/beta hydrolase n=1 Tax=Solidesulfovibrio carbinolicus TaxID=296842 RepID=A0A4P6HR78_9BACT|nr:alpha/beta hydrolase [Solidesulfovibrio carbinolicus]QAZ67768.1 alpha/beta hydrolase [Solidesulfovibrio carbinolicus]
MNAGLSPCRIETSLGPVEYAAYGDGPPLLCLHGAMGGFDQSAILGRLLAPEGWRVLAVSRPGYLGTPLGVREAPEAQADLCAALLTQLAVGPAAVMTVSGGGPCALHLALRHPRLTRGLMLVSTCSGRITERLPLAWHILRLAARFPRLGSLMRPKAASPEQAVKRGFRDPASHRAVMNDPEALALFAELSAQTRSRLGERLAGTVNDVDVTRSRDYPLEDIAVPTLVVHGTADPHVPFAAHGKQLAERIPGARLVALAGGEHAAIFSHRGQAQQAVAAFLSGFPDA